MWACCLRSSEEAGMREQSEKRRVGRGEGVKSERYEGVKMVN